MNSFETTYRNQSQHFTKPSVYSQNQWNYFQHGYTDKWRSGDFSIQTWCIPLEAFASKKPDDIQVYINTYETLRKIKDINNKLQISQDYKKTLF